MRLAIVLCAGLGACGTEDPPPDEEPVNCAEETRDDDFAVGLSKTGNDSIVGFTLMTANPAPPIRGDNSWTIQLNQMNGAATGAPIDGADLQVTPFMPDHGHPSAKTVRIEPTGVPGQYELSPINFWMPGLWETTIDVASPSGNDVVVFRFCIPS